MQVTGTIEKIFYVNQDTAWASVLLKRRDAPESDTLLTAFSPDARTLKASGIMPGLRVGMTVELTGEMESTRFGESLNVTEFVEKLPTTAEEIEVYLCSDFVKNIGKKLAHDIVEVFGDDTLNVLDNEPERLCEVYNIGKKRIQSIVDSWKGQKGQRDVMMWLLKHGVTQGLTVKIYKAYGNEAVGLLEENPYRLADEIKGIGFRRADVIAKEMGVQENSPYRIASGILQCLRDKASEGNTYYPLQMLLDESASKDYLGLDKVFVQEMFENIIKNNKVKEFVVEAGRAYLSGNYYAELIIAKRIKEIISDRSGCIDRPDVKGVEHKTGTEYSPEQRQAIMTALMEKISVITGGPGTGKTVTTNAIIRLFKENRKKVLLCAPTGRAAKRMKEVTGHEASTIHRLLEFAQGEFQRNRYNQLDGDAIIVDEASMIDAWLMRCLLEAVPDHMQVVIVGDVNQLPSVGPGCVLRDIIDSGAVPATFLKTIFRQATGSKIIVNAHAVNEGRMPYADNNDMKTDFWFVDVRRRTADNPYETEDEKRERERMERERISDYIIELVVNRIPKKFNVVKSDIQVLSPMRREGDPIATSVLNQRLQNALNPDGEVAARKGNTEFRIGDRIMQTRNDYDKGVFNGDIGTVVLKKDGTDDEKTVLVADFEGRPVGMSQADLNNIDLAYACTVHKSQGSEYPVIVMPVHESHSILLKRNLLYTAITRAQSQCILVGTWRAVGIAVHNEDTKKRFTQLKETLQGC